MTDTDTTATTASAAPRKKHTRWWVVACLLLVVGGGAISWHKDWLAPLMSATTTPHEAQDTESFVQHSAVRNAPAQNNASELQQEINTLSQRLDNLPPDPAPQIEALQQRMDAVEAAISNVQSTQSQTLVAMLSYDQLRRRIATGKPFATEFETAQHSLVIFPDALAAIAPLADYAPLGVPTYIMLKRDFANALKQALHPAANANSSLLSSVTANLESLVRIRKIGAQHTGDDDASRLARAEAHLKTHALEKALAEVEKLSDSTASIFSPWIHHAHALLDTREALRTLRASLLAAATPPQEQAP